MPAHALAQSSRQMRASASQKMTLKSALSCRLSDVKKWPFTYDFKEFFNILKVWTVTLVLKSPLFILYFECHNFYFI